jgi:sterol desaturase/sphingolipid hydroxylase (fatty acid hydroxylase superfamily)
MQVDAVVVAIPVFFALIGLEALVGRWLRRGSPPIDDLVGNLGCGVLQQLVQVFLRSTLFAAYFWVYAHHRLFSIPTNPWTWLLCFAGVDFLAYWSHRLGHRVAIFWAVHEVHHQSEDLSLAVSLRVPAFDFYSWALDLPLAFLGFSPSMYLGASAFVSIYGFWTHTRAIGSLGPLDSILVTPFNHRLHHARNPQYLDRNYGHVLVVWDKLLGTFVTESEEPVYGTQEPLRSWNPVWANVRYWTELIAKVRRLPRWTDRLRVLVMPPGWSPRGGPELGDVSCERGALGVGAVKRAYAVAQFFLALLGTVALLNAQARLGIEALAICAAAVTATVAVSGGMLDGRRWASRLELVRVSLAVMLSLAIL